MSACPTCHGGRLGQPKCRTCGQGEGTGLSREAELIALSMVLSTQRAPTCRCGMWGERENSWGLHSCARCLPAGAKGVDFHGDDLGPTPCARITARANALLRGE